MLRDSGIFAVSSLIFVICFLHRKRARAREREIERERVREREREMLTRWSLTVVY